MEPDRRGTSRWHFRESGLLFSLKAWKTAQELQMKNSGIQQVLLAHWERYRRKQIKASAIINSGMLAFHWPTGHGSGSGHAGGGGKAPPLGCGRPRLAGLRLCVAGISACTRFRPSRSNDSPPRGTYFRLYTRGGREIRIQPAMRAILPQYRSRSRVQPGIRATRRVSIGWGWTKSHTTGNTRHETSFHLIGSGPR